MVYKQNKTITQVMIVLCCVFLLASGVLAKQIRIDILSMNDFHGALVEEGKNPGAAKLATVIKDLRGANPKGTIVLSAGDMFQGTVRSNILAGKPVLEIMNKLGFAAMALGNHEFDWGLDVLRTRASEAQFPFLAANVTVKETGKSLPYVKPYTMVKVDGLNIGIIGLATPETAYTSSMNVVGKLDFTDPGDGVRKYAPLLRAQGADLVVALTHLDCETKEEKMWGGAKDLLDDLTAKGDNSEDFNLIDALVTGHSHTLVSDATGSVPVVQAMYNGRAVGRITMVYDTDIKKVVSVVVDVVKIDPKKVLPDRGVEKIVARSAKKARPIELSVIGSSSTGVDHDRHGVSPLGEWAADQIRQMAGADIAFMNGGGLRKPIPAGKITLGLMFDILPFDNTIVRMKLTGKQIMDVVEHGLNSELGVIQFAGIRVVAEPFGERSRRIVGITLADGTPLRADAIYTVATNDFLADGGDGFKTFTQGKDILNTNIVLREVFVNAVKAVQDLKVQSDGRLNLQGAMRSAA